MCAYVADSPFSCSEALPSVGCSSDEILEHQQSLSLVPQSSITSSPCQQTSPCQAPECPVTGGEVVRPMKKVKVRRMKFSSCRQSWHTHTGVVTLSQRCLGHWHCNSSFCARIWLCTHNVAQTDACLCWHWQWHRLPPQCFGHCRRHMSVVVVLLLLCALFCLLIGCRRCLQTRAFSHCYYGLCHTHSCLQTRAFSHCYYGLCHTHSLCWWQPS